MEMNELKEGMDCVGKFCKTYEEFIEHELAKNYDDIDGNSLYAAVDMMKDCAETIEKKAKTMYYLSIVNAMEEYGDSEDIPEETRRFFGGNRKKNIDMYRPPMYFTQPQYIMDRDMDRPYGRMYYSDGYSSSNAGNGMSNSSMGGSSTSNGNTRNYESRYDRARRNYTETREMHKSNTPQDEDIKTRELESYMNELSTDLTELVSDMSASEKTMLRTKLSNLVNKI